MQRKKEILYLIFCAVITEGRIHKISPVFWLLYVYKFAENTADTKWWYRIWRRGTAPQAGKAHEMCRCTSKPKKGWQSHSFYWKNRKATRFSDRNLSSLSAVYKITVAQQYQKVKRENFVRETFSYCFVCLRCLKDEAAAWGKLPEPLHRLRLRL